MTRYVRVVTMSALLIAGLTAMGCGATGEDPEAAGAAAELSPEELGELGARLEQEPSRAEEILEEAGLSWEELESAVRAVSADADTARRYTEAFLAAGGQGTPPGGAEA